jgi:putative salt-induced outer membrane protein
MTLRVAGRSGRFSAVAAMVAAATGLFAAGAATAAPIPDAVAAMIDAAAGDEAQLKTITDIAKKTNPDSAAEIDAKVAAIAAAQASAKEEKLASQDFFEGWSGSGEAGGFISTGNTSTRGVAVGVNVAKETRSWKHSLRGFVDYQRQDGVTTRERYFAGYEGNYNISPNLYALLTLAYERDTFSGFNRRFAESLGLGYKIVNSDTFKLAVEAGPALRQTRFTDGVTSNTFAARGAGNLIWTISPAVEFTENATVFYDSFNTSFQSISALTAKLNGALSARASFQFNSESNPPLGLKKTDTTSRVTLVYAF